MYKRQVHADLRPHVDDRADIGHLPVEQHLGRRGSALVRTEPASAIGGEHGPAASALNRFPGGDAAALSFLVARTGDRRGPVHGTGVWRSLVARFVRDEEVAGSNPVTPTTRLRPLTSRKYGQGPPSSTSVLGMRWISRAVGTALVFTAALGACGLVGDGPSKRDYAELVALCGAGTAEHQLVADREVYIRRAARAGDPAEVSLSLIHI